MDAKVWDVTDPIRHLIREKIEVDDARLADADVLSSRWGREPTHRTSRHAALAMTRTPMTRTYS
jgi:hypothetical protein